MGQPTGWVSISSPKVWPEALSGRMVPRKVPSSVKIVQRVAFGGARRPGADRDQLEPAIVLDHLHGRAERVEMGDDGARAFGLRLPR
jgi:hypothetical protein